MAWSGRLNILAGPSVGRPGDNPCASGASHGLALALCGSSSIGTRPEVDAVRLVLAARIRPPVAHDRPGGHDNVADYGYVEVHGVPGDQQTELRRQTRALVRKATGHSCQTLVHESMVVVMCDPIAQCTARSTSAKRRSA